MYQYPLSAPGVLSDWWQQALDGASAATPLTVVANPASGPINSANPDYANWITGLTLLRGNPNIHILGYVKTRVSPGSPVVRASADILSDVAIYNTAYKQPTTAASLIDGIFLDEMSNDVSNVSTYVAVANGIRASTGLAGHFIAGNPGTTVPNAYLDQNTADLFIVREGTPGDLTGNAVPSYVTSPTYAALGFGTIVHSAVGTSSLSATLRNIKLRQFDYAFVTDDTGADPYDQAPTYFQDLLRDIHAPYIAPTAYSLPENSAAEVIVGTPVSGDPDSGQLLTYRILAGNVGQAFAIDQSTGRLSVNLSTALDFETRPSFSLTVQVSDNASPVLSDQVTVSVNLTNVNDVPVARASSLTAKEDTGRTFATNTFLFTDAENNALTSVTISGLTLASGDTLKVNQGAGPVAVTNGMTITAAQLPMLVYTPAANANGANRSRFSFKVNDAGLGTVAATMTMNVTAVNDVPVARASSLTANEDTGRTFATNTFLFTDVESNALTSITISGLTLASGDTLKVNQGAGPVVVTNGMTITAAQLPMLVYTPAANANGANRSRFSFKVNDAGLGTVAATMTMNVAAVNDVPVAKASSVTTKVNTAKTFAVSTFLFTDVENNALVSISISGLTLATGDTLKVNQGAGLVAVTNGMTITAAQIATLVYTPATNALGANRSRFSFKVNDAGLGTIAATMSISVTT